ncbi:MAG: hypothetical protein IT303_01825 [Dehalococcoidia bacterium]|nr:hypothetical protein [Dehalococcoidia bacterium]
MMAGRRLVMLAAALLAGVAIACSSGDDETSATPTASQTAAPTESRTTAPTVSQTATAAATPTASVPTSKTPPEPTVAEHVRYHDYPATTGIAGVDTVIASVAAGDAGALITAVVILGVPCTPNPQGVGSLPRCPDGAAAGTLLELVPMPLCEGYYADMQEVTERITTAMSEAPRLYAVSRAESQPLGQATEADYLVTFGFREEQPAGIFRVALMADGTITGFSLCGLGTLTPPGGDVVLGPR